MFGHFYFLIEVGGRREAHPWIRRRHCVEYKLSTRKLGRLDFYRKVVKVLDIFRDS